MSAFRWEPTAEQVAVVAELVDGLLCETCSRPSTPEGGYPGCPCRAWADADRRERRRLARERRRHELAMTMLSPSRGRAA